VPVQNGRANGALRKLGAVEEGVLRRSARRGGEYCDQVLWSLLKDDWAARSVPAGRRLH
jgi:RimJ/RimL family protein N-acetyltransferase